MKRVWEKPELFVENYELTQVVAAGCGTKIVEVSTSSYVTMGCRQSGNGHWIWEGTYADLLAFADGNGDGDIDWSEFKSAVGSAQNGVQTGNGHEGHGIRLTIDGVEYTEQNVPFNS